MPGVGIVFCSLFLTGVAVWFLAVIIRDVNRFVVVEYRVKSAKIKRSCKAVMLSDLHDKEYGENNCRLMEAVHAVEPEMIFVAGDMMTANEEKTDYRAALRLMEQLAGEYPVYYGIGNHEYRMKMYPYKYGNGFERYVGELKKLGIRVLENERVFLPDINVEVCGLEIEKGFYKRFKHKKMEKGYLDRLLGKSREERYELLIAHNPDYFKEYAAWGADLTLAGHVHGGVVRLPFLGGVVSPMMHLFPKYDGGLFEEYGKRMILGRGLGMHTIPVRMFNPGEMIVLYLEP